MADLYASTIQQRKRDWDRRIQEAEDHFKDMANRHRREIDVLRDLLNSQARPADAADPGLPPFGNASRVRKRKKPRRDKQGRCKHVRFVAPRESDKFSDEDTDSDTTIDSGGETDTSVDVVGTPPWPFASDACSGLSDSYPISYPFVEDDDGPDVLTISTPAWDSAAAAAHLGQPTHLPIALDLSINHEIQLRPDTRYAPPLTWKLSTCRPAPVVADNGEARRCSTNDLAQPAVVQPVGRIFVHIRTWAFDDLVEIWGSGPSGAVLVHDVVYGIHKYLREPIPVGGFQHFQCRSPQRWALANRSFDWRVKAAGYDRTYKPGVHDIGDESAYEQRHGIRRVDCLGPNEWFWGIEEDPSRPNSDIFLLVTRTINPPPGRSPQTPTSSLLRG